jgi:hypothetical protein
LVAGYLVIFVWGGYCFFIKKGRWFLPFSFILTFVYSFLE